jgi:hypothetical protein
MFLASFGVLVFCRSLREKIVFFSCVIVENQGEDEKSDSTSRSSNFYADRETNRSNASPADRASSARALRYARPDKCPSVLERNLTYAQAHTCHLHAEDLIFVYKYDYFLIFGRGCLEH